MDGLRAFGVAEHIEQLHREAASERLARAGRGGTRGIARLTALASGMRPMIAAARAASHTIWASSLRLY